MYASPTTAVHLSVSIVLHNSAPVRLWQALDSLVAAAMVARREGLLDRLTLFLVDNASRPDYRAELQRRLEDWPGESFIEARCLLRKDNRGFGTGHNAVLEGLDSDLHLVLNPDVELRENSLVRGIGALSEGRGVALVCPRVFGENGEQEYLCKRYPSVLTLLLRGFAPRALRRRFDGRLAHYEMRELRETSGPVDVRIASGCFMLLPTAVLRAVGGFDEKFFLYFEDFDLSLRLGAGGRLVYRPEVCIVHHGGYAARKGLRHVLYFLVSAVRFFSRHGWRWV
jgi:GT2 family glycosyltransferase